MNIDRIANRIVGEVFPYKYTADDSKYDAQAKILTRVARAFITDTIKRVLWEEMAVSEAESFLKGEHVDPSKT